jgi:hypothetical protein
VIGEFECRRLCKWGPCERSGCGEDEGKCVHFRRNPEGVGECTPGWTGPPLAETDGGDLQDCR